MDEKAATAVRSKRDSTMRVGLRLVREGRAAGFVSAGNTGAMMATAKDGSRHTSRSRSPGDRCCFPTQAGTVSVMVDVGANVDAKPHNLEQFAIMGDIYSRQIFGTKKPRVGLLSVGEEESKGERTHPRAFPLLKALPITSSATSKAATCITAKPTSSYVTALSATSR